MAGFVFVADSVDFYAPGNGIVHLFGFAGFVHAVDGRRDVICVGIPGRDTPAIEIG